MYPCTTGLPQGVESQDSEQFFRKVLGVPDGSSLGGMKPILDGSKGELNRSALPQRPALSGIFQENKRLIAFEKENISQNDKS